MSLAGLLNYSATPQRHTPTAGAVGGIRKEWTDLHPAVPVRPQDAKAETKRRYASDNIIVTHTILTEYGGMQVGDRFNTDQEYWLLKGIRQRRGIGGIDTFFAYDCEQVMVRKE